MRIVLVTEYFSEGMGYLENCLPKALSALGHSCSVICSTLNVNGDRPDYSNVYERFLGPSVVPPGRYPASGFDVLRLEHHRIGGYIVLDSLGARLKELSPDVVQATAAASLNTYQVLAFCLRHRVPLFTECHQCLSVTKPYMANPYELAKRAVYRATRTLPGRVVAARSEYCFAAGDTIDVASRLYGVPAGKLLDSPIVGTDTDLFRPADQPGDAVEREETRRLLGISDGEVVCIYAGRLSAGKNPALLAKAVERLRSRGNAVKGLFIGEGPQNSAIRATEGCVVLPFMRHQDLARLYRAAEIGVWPDQESMSMLDASASGLPVVANDKMGQPERLRGCGLQFSRDDADSLVETLTVLMDQAVRRRLGQNGRRVAVRQFSWKRIAEIRLHYYRRAIGARR